MGVMVAREGEFRQCSNVSRSGYVVVGYSGQGHEKERKEGMILLWAKKGTEWCFRLMERVVSQFETR